MKTECEIQLHLDGAWRTAGTVHLTGDPADGHRTPGFIAYTLDHALAHAGRRDAAAFCHALPVSMDMPRSDGWPPFLLDLLPQGYGRAELLRELNLPARAEASADWPLLLAGAGNPIGNLRIREARDWLDARMPATEHGFTPEQVGALDEHFAEQLARHGLFIAGSSGVQGEWPKLLLTEAADGSLHLDHALPDDRAARHWLVKFHRGGDAAFADILRMEAGYLRLARRLGLRVHGEPKRVGRALFIPRFDREASDGRVLRHAQESLASLCGLAGFGPRPTHDLACARLAAAATDPLAEVVEYLRRDIANIALGNKDNHARNTAIRRGADGVIGLTPLFDFAPMLLHPDGIARVMRWPRDDDGAPRWASVIDQAADASRLPASELRRALAGFAPAIAALPGLAADEGIDAALIARLRPGIDNIADQLARL